MPRELVALAPRRPALREYTEPALGRRQVRIRTEFAAPKHGTELVLYRGTRRSIEVAYDREWGCLLPRAAVQQARLFPRRLGNMAVGVVAEAGAGVTRFWPGDRVFGHLPIRETHTVDEDRVDRLPEGLAPEVAVCLDPAVMALALRDAGIRLGDRVAVFGLGAIGLMAAQLARLAGASQVIAVDPIAPRRGLAARYGADVAIAPVDDTGLAVRRLTRLAQEADGGSGGGGTMAADLVEALLAMPGPQTAAVLTAGQARRLGKRVVGGYVEAPTQWGGLGVDVAVEASGSPRALQDAIRATRFGGTVSLLSFYGGSEAAGLRLGEEFHLNRLSLVSCRAESLPLRAAPGWTLERQARTALRWLATGRLRADGMVAPIVPFEAAVEAYREIDEHPERSIKLGVRFDGY